MIDLPLRAKRLVAGAVLRSAAPWAMPFIAVVTSPWLGFLDDGVWMLGMDRRLVLAAAVVPFLVAVAVTVWFPHARMGEWAVRRLRDAGARASLRTANVTEQLAIATGATSVRHDVTVIDSPVPNVATLPGEEGSHVVVTTGAEERLDRDALEALLATQVVVASDRWVRLASAAQAVGSLRFALLFGSPFLNPLLLPFAFLAFAGHRRADMVRDMVADAAALRATRHPEALSRALWELRPAAPAGNKVRTGLPAFVVDQFWVLSTRMKVTTTVSGPTGQRRWTTTDEIAAEMAMRADRIRRAADGDEGALFDVRSWKRAVKGLGTDRTTPLGYPLALTPEERATAAEIDAALQRA